MARENLTNFATSTLAAPGIGAADTAFSVATGQGALFPSVSAVPAAGTLGSLPYTPQPFIVAIDSELIAVSARSADTFTVQTRGYDGTTAASHSTGATVALVIERDMLDRLWGAVADTYNPNVPPYDQYANPSAPNGYSDEFDSQSANWTIYPLTSNLGGADSGASIDFATTYRSNLFFQRTTSSTTTYWVYQPITLSAATVIKWRWSHGLQFANLANTTQLTGYARFFISDQLNPTSSLWAGNGLFLGLGYDQSGVAFYPGTSSTTQNTDLPIFQAAQSASNTYSLLQYALYSGQTHGALSWDGGTTWTFWVGDGMTWTSVSSVSMSLTPQSMGFRFELANNNSAVVQQSAVIDWIRVGTQLYGNA